MPKEPKEKGRLNPTEESRQAISEEELDEMIDQSVNDMKSEGKAEEKSEEKEKPAEENKEQPKDRPSEAKKEQKEPKKEAAKPEAAKKEPTMKVVEGYDPWKVLKYPHLAEKSMNMVEMENKLIFIVRRDSSKEKIREAVEKGFGVKVLAVNVTITRKGHKKAYVKLAPDYSAADIATRLGMI